MQVHIHVHTHTLNTSTCTHTVTTHTFLPFCLHVFPKQLHPRIALHRSDDVTDIRQGFCITCLLQACMKELGLKCCIHFLPALHSLPASAAFTSCQCCIHFLPVLHSLPASVASLPASVAFTSCQCCFTSCQCCIHFLSACLLITI